MSDKGDKVCPLCTEEMDLTDQQLKPCQCGYEICVWCWNHIMEMAEKEKTEGLCPACRSSYDKERIVGMAANCERLVAEINSERKVKSQKAKPKQPEGRMHLTNVRVIQRNLVYIIGLPLNLADEALLQRKEYFGQYGKVLKVSISKTSTGAIQHSSNNSCCVYITYSKEDDAVRCIQSVHSFVLEGRPLRACFGTTKYCHSWLRNLPCSIPDCLYLHEFGTQEDSFTKDDLVSAFTRSKVPQNIGATNNLHRRAGNMLPSPTDDYDDRNVLPTALLDCKSSLNTVVSSDSESCADGGTEKSKILPAAASWVMRVSSNVAPAACLSSSAGNHKPETSSGSQILACEVVSPKGFYNVKNELAEQSCDIAIPSTGSWGLGLASPSSPATVNEDEDFQADDGDFPGLCSSISSISTASHPNDENSSSTIPENSFYNHNLPTTHSSHQDVNIPIESSASPALRKSSIVEDLLRFDDQQLKCSGDTDNLPSTSCLFPSKQNLAHLSYRSWQQGEINDSSTNDAHQSTGPIICNDAALPPRSGMTVPSSGFFDNQLSSHSKVHRTCDYSSILSDVYMEGCDNAKVSSDRKASMDIGENSIISSILSLDMDSWEDTLTSPQSLVKLLSETDKQHSKLKLPSIRKAQDSSQSRFSFARHDDFIDQGSNLGQWPAKVIGTSAPHHSNESKFLGTDNKYRDISSNHSFVESNSLLSSHPFAASTFPVSKAPTSPPGFSISSRAVPPGFPSNGALNYEANYIPHNSALSSRKFGGSADVEFFDPATMEVGDGLLAARMNNSGFDMRPALSSHLSPLSHDRELQLLMQQQVSVKQNHRLSDHMSRFSSPPNDAYNIPSMFMCQSPPNNPSPFAQMTAQQVRNVHMSSGRWGSWDEIKSVNNLGTPEYLMNGRLGFNKVIPSHEDLRYQMSSSSNLYNRGFAL
ncbi:uncharacterized protein LOC126679424 [Mercurialis annua]|uniref:uncharacterized protein LOC126679424 n=1 Tax=Mercurialis annua TaxID=3986 RepID=UPI00215DD5C9|nr:uncharacterized protein LOC126679424 [Mercurialis annua]XP_050230403.1 uncharacterized protein LOC126679424 [Mercurialis annua]